MQLLRSIPAWLFAAALLARAWHTGGAQTVGAPKPAAHAAPAASMTAADAARMQAALADYDAGNVLRARPVLVELAARYRRNAEVQAAAGMASAESGDTVAAERFLQAAHALAPGNSAVSLNLAVALVKNGHAAEALSLLSAAVRQQPNDADLRLTLAQTQLQVGQAPAAADSFRKADALLHAKGQATDADLRHDWAVALLNSNQATEAVTVLQAAADADRSAPVQALLAEAEEKSGHFESAAQHFRRAAELDPSEANLYAYGNEMMQHWTFPAAIQILSFATQKYPGSERLAMALGIAYFGNGMYDKAVPVFQALLTARPDSAPTADLLGRSCSALAGAQQAGCATLLSFAQRHPGNAPASLYAAVAMLHQPADKQDAAAAESLLRNALHADPKLAEAWYELGALQQSQGKWQDSETSLQRAIAVRPGYAEAHYRLARAYSHLGRREEAQQQIALQQQSAAGAKAAENKRMQEVMTFLTTSN